MKVVVRISVIVILVSMILFGCCFYAIETQRQRTVKEMANKILSSAEYYMMSQIMNNNVHDVTINFPNNDLLDVKGDLPQNGYVKVTSDSRIEILFHYNGYCVSKNSDEIDNQFNKISKAECLVIELDK